MGKLIGFTNMKKYEGKVLFLANDNGAEVGHSCEVVRLYGEKAKQIDSSVIGKDIEFKYGCIQSGDKKGQAYIKSVLIG